MHSTTPDSEHCSVDLVQEVLPLLGCSPTLLACTGAVSRLDGSPTYTLFVQCPGMLLLVLFAQQRATATTSIPRIF